MASIGKKGTWTAILVAGGMGLLVILFALNRGSSEESGGGPLRPKSSGADLAAESTVPGSNAKAPGTTDAGSDTEENRSPIDVSADQAKELERRQALRLAKREKREEQFNAGLKVLIKKCLDESRSPRERLETLKEIQHGGIQVIPNEVADSLSRLVDALSDPVLTAEFLKNLVGAGSDAFKHTALQRLQKDASFDVRQAAFDALKPLKSDSEVRAALQVMIDQNPADPISRQAARLLIRR